MTNHQSNLGLARRAAQAILNENSARINRVQQLLSDPETRVSDETEQAIHDAARALAQQGQAVVQNVKRKYKARWYRGKPLRLSGK